MKPVYNILIFFFFGIVIAWIIAISLVNLLEVKEEQPNKIEEVKKQNDTLIIKVDSLRNEQYIKIEEARNANDSITLELWYKLLKE